MTDGILGIAGGAMLIGAVAAGGTYLALAPKQAETTGQAMMIVQSLSQTSGSITAKRLMNGGAAGGEDVRALVAEGYLGVLPQNPTTKKGEGLPVVAAAASEDGVVRDIVQMPLQDDGKLCDEIQQQTNGEKAVATDAFPLSRTGCVKTSTGPVAFSRI